MRKTWDQIERAARRFSDEWADATDERSETQSFYNDFFAIFGINRRKVAAYEKRVRQIRQKNHGFIDLFWPGVLLVEQKSHRKDLLKAQGQALDYLDGVHPTEQPRYVLTCDFQNWTLLDLETGGERSFKLCDLHKHVAAFDFMLGRKTDFKGQEDVTIKAAELMGKVHDALEDSGYTGHDLEHFLVRLLFCLFADNTGIFQPRDIFLQLLVNDTRPDGSDTGDVLSRLFQVLDTPEGKRLKGTSDELDAFPYINGDLFADPLRIPQFDKKMREHLINACEHNWSAVSPAIFGSLFQSVMDAKSRRAKGAHYTSEKNILKLIRPLFLDELEAELTDIRTLKIGQRNKLIAFQHKLSRLTLFDPACGCGNFLVIAYREIRRLELECLKAIYGDQQMDAALLSLVTVDQFYGIELEEFPARIAEVAMWMMDHIANNELNEAFRANYARIPLTQGAHIRHGNALGIDWADVLPPEKCDYVLGNPPFIGAKYQTADQRAQVRDLARLGGSGGTLDYVAAWFLKAGEYLQSNKRIKIAFVATNSITQGEQVAQLWPILFERYGLEIAFAHRTFQWDSEASGKAHVHVVIIGLSHRKNEPKTKRLFSYPDIRKEPVESEHKALTAYLFDASGVSDRHLVVREESRPINNAPRLITGTQPIDGNHLKFDSRQKRDFLAEEPNASTLIQPYVGAKEFIRGESKWILNLENAPPDQIRSMPLVVERLNRVRAFRTNSKRKATNEMAAFPTRFGISVVPKQSFLAMPQVSSERRDYAPIGWLEPPAIPSEKLRLAKDAELWHFGVLTSTMHMAWMRSITGRLESRYMYSVGVVYNTFPWPDASTAQRKKIEDLAQAVLDARDEWPTSSLADLYDPDTMPANLRKAHNALDRAVDKLYRRKPFEEDRERVEHLFSLYEKLVNPLSDAERQNKRAERNLKRKKA